MKRSSKYSGGKWPDVLFTLVCFAGAGLGLWLFWTDITRTLIQRSEKPVGVLSYKRHVVQRRFEDRLMWSQIPQESPVYNGDLVRTSDLSDAVITFVSEDSVRLAENSIIHVRYDEASNSFIELLAGDINFVSASGKMGILSGDQTLLPASGSALNVRRDSSGTEARTLSGSAEISGPGGLVRGLEAGKTAKAGEDGAVNIREALVVSGPLPNQELEAGANPMPVSFSWTGNLSPTEYVRLEIAEDQNFSSLVYAEDTYDTDGAVVPLPPGVWWWRIFQAERGNPLPASAAQDGRLTVLEPPPAPETAMLIFPSGFEESSTLPVLHAAQAPSPVQAPPLAQAAPVQPAPVYAPPVPAEPPLLPAPGGLFPPSGTAVDPLYLKTDARIAFSWNPVAGANAYIVTIKRGLTVRLHMVWEPRFVFTNLASLDNGEWTWEVEALSLHPDGSVRRHGEISAGTFNFQVPRPDAPQLNNPGIIYER
jgi:hypothetical protein